MIVDAIVCRTQDEPGATVYFGQYGNGSHDMEVEFKDFGSAMRSAVRAGGTITLVVSK